MHFQFTKHKSLITAPTSMPGPGPYYTSIVEMTGIADFPYRYALFFSTDHHNGPGGLWVYFCNASPADGPWVSYDEAVAQGDFDYISDKPAANPIFIDTVQGDGHTETPHVNIIDGTVLLSYHKNGIEKTQRTILALSDDGINYRRKNGDADSVILRDAAEDPGDGHTGYFRWSKNPFSGIAQKYIGYSLHGGGDNYYSALWASDNGQDWQRLEILIPIEGQAVEHDDRMIVWHEMDPASIRPLGNGEYVGICGVGNRASGAAARIVELYAVYLAADGCTLSRPSEKILSVGDAEADDAEELTSPAIVDHDGQLQLLYVGAKQNGSINTIMSALGTWDENAVLKQPLDPAVGRQHLYS